MAAPLHPARRLLDLCRRDGVSLPTLARVIGRSEGYLRRRLDGSTYLLDVRREEREVMAGFFAVPIAELGG